MSSVPVARRIAEDAVQRASGDTMIAGLGDAPLDAKAGPADAERMARRAGEPRLVPQPPQAAGGQFVHPAAAVDPSVLSHNLVGQRLGRKGRDTRERILAAAARLVAEQSDTMISLSAVAREASLAMTTLYLYFSDLTELLIAVLEPIMASAEDTYLAGLRVRWPDEDVGSGCLAFVQEYYAFWLRHTRILHLRNTITEANDKRMRIYRIMASAPVFESLVKQMDADPTIQSSPATTTATVLLTGLERLVTVTTDTQFPFVPLNNPHAHVANLLKSQARLIEIAIRDCRTNRGM